MRSLCAIQNSYTTLRAEGNVNYLTPHRELQEKTNRSDIIGKVDHTE